MTDTIERLSASMLLTAEMCGELFRRQYIEKIRMPRKSVLIIGSSVHRSRGHSLGEKLKTGELPTPEEIDDMSATFTTAEIEGGEIVCDEGESVDDFNGLVYGRSHRLSRCDYEQLQPGIDPEMVEQKVVIDVDGLPPISAICDVSDKDNAIHEFKTGGPKSRVTETDAHRSEQITVYALAQAIGKKLGEVPVTAYYEKVRDMKRGATAATVVTSRDSKDMQAIINRFATLSLAIERGVFLPASRQFSWKCDPKYCDHYEDCSYVTNPVTVGWGG